MKWFIVLSLFILCGCQQKATLIWDGKIANSFGGGTGTKADPYLIKTTQQLAYLAKEVSNGKDYAGIFFNLEENLDMGGDLEKPLDWKPIGTTKKKEKLANENNYVVFNGCFNGNNKNISNMRCGPSPSYFVGLFSIIGKNGVVCNLNVMGGHNIILAAGTVGGICGKNYGRIINCHVRGEFELGMMGCDIGGIAGINGGIIEMCSFRGSLKGERSGGGITGDNMREGVVDNCCNLGKIIMGSHISGGIAGYDNSGKIKNCYTIDSYISSSISHVEHCYIGFLKEPDGMYLGTFVNLESMKTDKFVDLLNQNRQDRLWGRDENNINNGFPVIMTTYIY